MMGRRLSLRRPCLRTILKPHPLKLVPCDSWRAIHPQVIRLGGELLKEASCGLFASLELGEKVETYGRHRMVISHL